MSADYITREALRGSQGAEHTVWFMTDVGKVTIGLSAAGLRELHRLVTTAVAGLQAPSKSLPANTESEGRASRMAILVQQITPAARAVDAVNDCND